MDTNDIHKTSLPIADNCAPSRTKSGQEGVTGGHAHPTIPIPPPPPAKAHIIIGAQYLHTNPSRTVTVVSLTGPCGMIEVQNEDGSTEFAMPEELATPPAPAAVEEWEPLAVIRRLSDLYRSNKSDTEVSARAMAMIQEFGARLSRATPPAERPTMNCPHCGSGLLWSEDRGAHCDGCDDFDPEMDLPTPPAERPTPETDGKTFDPYPWNNNGPGRSYQPEVMYPCDDGSWVDADHARRLERQLAESRDQRDSLADALRSIRQMTRNDERCSVCTEVYHSSNAALAAVKGGTNATDQPPQ